MPPSDVSAKRTRGPSPCGAGDPLGRRRGLSSGRYATTMDVQGSTPGLFPGDPPGGRTSTQGAGAWRSTMIVPLTKSVQHWLVGQACSRRPYRPHCGCRRRRGRARLAAGRVCGRPPCKCVQAPVGISRGRVRQRAVLSFVLFLQSPAGETLSASGPKILSAMRCSVRTRQVFDSPFRSRLTEGFPGPPTRRS